MGAADELWAACTTIDFVCFCRQERRSKIYSFGLGKRQSADSADEFDTQHSDKRSESRRQFSFGLGKRDADESSNVNSTS